MIPVKNAYQDYLDEQRYRRIEKKIKTQKTKKENEEKNISIRKDVMSYFRQGILETVEADEGIVSLLDETMPSVRQTEYYKEEYELMLRDKDTSAFTITFKQIHRDNMNEKQLRLFLKNSIKSICLRREIPIHYMLAPDIDANGNFHFHGAVKMPLKHRPTFKRLLTYAVGFNKMSYITNIDKWYEYTFKDIGLNETQVKSLFLIDRFL